MKILLSWSSGKDSAWALHVLRRDGAGEVAGLLTSVNVRGNSRVPFATNGAGTAEGRVRVPVLSTCSSWPP